MKSEKNNFYLNCRKELNLTRQEACDYFPTINEDRLERIENGRKTPSPEDILEISNGYKKYIKDKNINLKTSSILSMCNHYCTNICKIGQYEIEEVHIKDISQITLETLVSLNKISNKSGRLAEITVDGKITQDELYDFISIKHDLEQISMTIDSLKLWTEQMLSNGSIDENEYQKIKNKIYNE